MGLYWSFQVFIFNLLCHKWIQKTHRKSIRNSVTAVCDVFYVFIPQLNRHIHAYNLQAAEKPLSVIEFRIDQRGEMSVRRLWCRVLCYSCRGKCWVVQLGGLYWRVENILTSIWVQKLPEKSDVQNVVSIHILGAEITGRTLRWSSGVVREKNARRD